MASLNLSINGPSIKSSYQGVINAQLPKSSSSTWGHWALFSVQAPLVNAFQDSNAKESILKVESTGEGELADLAEDFNEGRIQLAFVKVKDPNSGLPKNVFIAWCGGGVPERTKGYFTSHTAAAAKILHGYHVQITARSDSDLEPAAIMMKVADASGAKYAGGASDVLAAAAPPPVAKKPVFTPTTSGTSSAFNPLVAARNRQQDADDDGWGGAPQVNRTELQKVESAYKPTKVNMTELMRNKDESRTGGSGASNNGPEVVKGAYQPVGKIDIAAIRAQAKEVKDDRPTIVKGAYEPVGKVDIAAIRARAQRPSEVTEPTDEAPASSSLADRTAAFNQPERLTQLPKPKVAKKFGGSAFTGTKAPVPGALGLGGPSVVPSVTPVGAASRTFADEGGKTPAQIWAEKKARQSGGYGSSASPPLTSPILAQGTGGEWKSGYAGKSWAPVSTTNFGRGGIENQPTEHSEAPLSPAGGISALKDRFNDTTPMGGTAPTSRGFGSSVTRENTAPLPPPGSRPSGGFSLPSLPARPPAQDYEDEDDADGYDQRESSPVRVALPVARGSGPKDEPPEERLPPRPIPVPQDPPKERESAREEDSYDTRAAAESQHAQKTGGKQAVVQYDYEKAEDNEIDLAEGEKITNIDMVDDDWWMGTNSQGESGLFPSNYVELVEDDAAPAAARPPPPPAAAASQPAAAAGGATATAQFDYEAAEDNELSFPEGAKITGLDFPDEDWWFGHYQGSSGLFPANYVQLDS